MNFWTLLFMITVITVGTASLRQSDNAQQRYTSEGVASAASIRIYRTAVLEYAAAHPTVTGAVPDSELPLPAWFRNVYTVRNYLQGSKSFVYLTPSTTARVDLSGMIQGDQEEPLSVFFGVAEGGMLRTPGDGVTQITLPAIIPNGSFVYAM